MSIQTQNKHLGDAAAPQHSWGRIGLVLRNPAVRPPPRLRNSKGAEIPPQGDFFFLDLMFVSWAAPCSLAFRREDRLANKFRAR